MMAFRSAMEAAREEVKVVEPALEEDSGAENDEYGESEAMKRLLEKWQSVDRKINHSQYRIDMNRACVRLMKMEIKNKIEEEAAQTARRPEGAVQAQTEDVDVAAEEYVGEDGKQKRMKKRKRHTHRDDEGEPVGKPKRRVHRSASEGRKKKRT
jgi:hypothetical protein